MFLFTPRAFKILSFAAILCAFATHKGFSCSCRNLPSFYWHYNYSELVFKGRSLHVKTNAVERRVSILFLVLKKYKGNFSSDTLTIETGLGNGDCGLPVDTNEVWIIFSTNGQTNICSHNFPLEARNYGVSPAARQNYERDFLKPLEEMKNIEKKYIKEYDSKKRLVAEGEMLKGIPQGCWKYYYVADWEEATTKEVVFYRNGLKDSIAREYIKKAKLAEEKEWKNGLANGREVRYFADESVNYSGNYVNGEKNGEWKYYFKNKQLKETETYDLGKKTGINLSFYENGDTSVISTFNASGKMIKSVSWYPNRNLQWISTYERSGDSFMEDWIYYYENGKTRTGGKSYYNGKEYKNNGEILTYYENGNPKEKKYYQMGKETGTWYYYDEEGKLIKTENK